MKISDEIRKWCDFYCGKSINRYDCDNLSALADRIDSEMVELPKDRDGFPIHIGDKVWTVENSAVSLKVRFITLFANGKAEVNAVGEGCDAYVDPSALVHTCPADSFERIACDIESSKGTVLISEKTLDDWADRIRKLAAKEDQR